MPRERAPRDRVVQFEVTSRGRELRWELGSGRIRVALGLRTTTLIPDPEGWETRGTMPSLGLPPGEGNQSRPVDAERVQTWEWEGGRTLALPNDH